MPTNYSFAQLNELARARSDYEECASLAKEQHSDAMLKQAQSALASIAY